MHVAFVKHLNQCIFYVRKKSLLDGGLYAHQHSHIHIRKFQVRALYHTLASSS